MSSPEALRRRPADLALTFAVFAALLAAMLPLLRVIGPGRWQPASFLLAGGILCAGYFARRRRLPALAVTVIEMALWVIALTFFFFRDTAVLWVIPSPNSFRDVPDVVAGAISEVVVGAAPLDAGHDLTVLLVGAVGLLAIILDHVVITARMPLLAAVGVVAVWLIPAIAVPSTVDIVAFVLLAVAILFLLRAETRAREPGEGDGVAQRRPAGIGATAFGIGAIALVVAVAVTPVLPTPIARAGASNFGIASTIDPTLELGDDLRRLQQVEVLTVRSDAPFVPYLRAATLSRFDGSVWDPDRVRTLPLASEFGLGELDVSEDVRVTEYRTTVEVKNLASPWLPVAFPAVGVEGLTGSWEAMPYNRTVISRGGSSQGESYVVVTHQARPSLEQIRATSAGGPSLLDETYSLPAEMPAAIFDTANAVTGAASTDYDKLIALQSYFRGADFTYSLEAPVDDGFDGSGVDAIAAFLDAREGYCVHFASTFAVMARSLGMPSRIVVGYLPGTSTNDSVEGETLYSVQSDQLHAWPEVHFDGVGWVPFEPTKSLGTPTAFSPAASSPLGGGEEVTPGEAAPAPTSSASAAPRDLDAQLGNEASGTSGAAGVDPRPVLTSVLAALVIAAAPALLRALRWRRRLAATRRGDAGAAWLSVRELAVDLGVDVPASETPRAFGARLVAAHDAPAEPMRVLVDAIERSSYAAAGAQGGGDAMADAAASVRAGMLAAVSGRERLAALLLPRSLVVRPGSAYAA